MKCPEGVPVSSLFAPLCHIPHQRKVETSTHFHTHFHFHYTHTHTHKHLSMHTIAPQLSRAPPTHILHHWYTWIFKWVVHPKIVILLKYSSFIHNHGAKAFKKDTKVPNTHQEGHKCAIKVCTHVVKSLYWFIQDRQEINIIYEKNSNCEVKQLSKSIVFLFSSLNHFNVGSYEFNNCVKSISYETSLAQHKQLYGRQCRCCKCLSIN